MTSRARPTYAAWGPAIRGPLPTRAAKFLSDTLGPARPQRATPLAHAQQSVPKSSLPPAAAVQLALAVGSDYVQLAAGARAMHAGGLSYLDLVRRRAGDVGGAPDAVVLPATHDEVGRVLKTCSQHRVAVVPFGGGTSVVGGVEPLRGQFSSVIALDLGRMNGLLSIDRESLTATFEPGMTGAEAEKLLLERGLTLGHFPQSFERATLGGYVATRSAGQASAGYGRIDDLVVSMRVASPTGELRLGRSPGSAAGPDLLHLFMGSEGILGVITEVTLRVRPEPQLRLYDAWLLPDFATGVRTLRQLAQSAGTPDLLRLSDEAETRASLAMSGPTGVAGKAVGSYLKQRGVDAGCLVIAGWEGEPDDVRRRRHRSRERLRAAGGVPLGKRAAKGWVEGRYAGPHLRDQLLDSGYLVETLETATFWSRLESLHELVTEALTAALRSGAQPHVMCHVSHVYPTGASLYFTVLAEQDLGHESDQWKRAKAAANAAIVAAGATITHHHAVGTDHRPHLVDEIGSLGVQALQAVKRTFDPIGVLNPGKLLPDP